MGKKYLVCLSGSHALWPGYPGKDHQKCAGRAGSAPCNEIAASGTPCILIPSPNVTNNHQEKNARVLEEGGGAVVVLEKDCTPEKMYELITGLLADEARREQMSRKLHTMVHLNSTERICDIVESLSKR